MPIESYWRAVFWDREGHGQLIDGLPPSRIINVYDTIWTSDAPARVAGVIFDLVYNRRGQKAESLNELAKKRWPQHFERWSILLDTVGQKVSELHEAYSKGDQEFEAKKREVMDLVLGMFGSSADEW